jgi:hypothetical protein
MVVMLYHMNTSMCHSIAISIMLPNVYNARTRMNKLPACHLNANIALVEIMKTCSHQQKSSDPTR